MSVNTRGVSRKVKRYARGILRELFDWRPQAAAVPRARCHFMAFDVRNIPQRQIASSLRLQLTQLSGLKKFGFAWRAEGGHAQAWYWDEAELSANDLTTSNGNRTSPANGLMPWPEPLLRAPLGDGLHLIACTQGFEAIAIENGKLHRTRWLAQRPTEDIWTAFVRDAGGASTKRDMPAPKNASVLARPAPGWKVSTHLVKPLPVGVWAGLTALTLVGMVLIAGIIHEAKLESTMQELQAKTQKLLKDNATTIALQKEIDGQAGYLDAMMKARPHFLQLMLMQGMADSALLGRTTGINLLEWEYRDNRLRILFAVPEEGFSLGEFLAKLERQPMFKEIRLMPDTPPRTVGIQATLANNAGRSVNSTTATTAATATNSTNATLGSAAAQTPAVPAVPALPSGKAPQKAAG